MLHEVTRLPSLSQQPNIWMRSVSLARDQRQTSQVKARQGKAVSV